MRTVRVELKGTMPLIMHADNIEWADKMEEWKNDPRNKALSRAGDDRTPAWRWLGCLNYDDPKTGVVTIPSEYIMASVLGGATGVLVGNGKKTFKEQSQSGILPPDLHWPLLINGGPISMKDINECLKEKTFRGQMEMATAMGFTLYVKRARIGLSKHIRVRPRFDEWSTSGDLMILDEQITNNVLQSIFDIAGRLKGMGDWRPGAKKPGPFGTFKVTIS